MKTRDYIGKMEKLVRGNIRPNWTEKGWGGWQKLKRSPNKITTLKATFSGLH